MKTKTESNTASPATPPNLNLYTRHAFSLSRMANLLHAHWLSFGIFLGDNKATFDEVRIERIRNHFFTLTREMEYYAAEIANANGASDADYLRDLPEIIPLSEYCPIEQLAEFDRLSHERWDSEPPDVVGDESASEPEPVETVAGEHQIPAKVQAIYDVANDVTMAAKALVDFANDAEDSEDDFAPLEKDLRKLCGELQATADRIANVATDLLSNFPIYSTDGRRWVLEPWNPYAA